jgi:hypothetical protein
VTATDAGGASNVAAQTQVFGGRTYRFTGWSDGGSPSHTIVTPTNPTTYTARFKRGGKA